MKNSFEFKPFSPKQKKILTWWRPESPVKDKDGIICDGAIRSGKTFPMAISFVLWAMETFEEQNFAFCSKTVGAFRRNVWCWLKLVLICLGFRVLERRTENLITISKNGITNNFHVFSAKDESSQDLIQGFTLAGVLFDEVALMPESFVNQATGRCSVEGSKFWFNCNPDSPEHWFKKNWLDKKSEKNLIHLSFQIEDNWSLSEKIIKRYKSLYFGVFYKRLILGLWVIAEGAIYDMFDDDNLYTERNQEIYYRRYIGIDYGTTNPMVFGDYYDDSEILYKENEYYYDSRIKGRQKTDKEYADDFEEFIKDGKRPDYVIIDPSAASFKVELRNRGYRVKDADNDVLDGIRLTATMLGLKKLLVHKENCPKTQSELRSYVWDEKALRRGIEQPLKENDHTSDETRYVVKTIVKSLRYRNA